MNIDQMPAGIELDILVAEALGYVRVLVGAAKKNPPGAKTFVFTVADKVPSFADGVYIRHVSGGDFRRFAPSTDIVAAFQVVDELLDGTRVFVLECYMPKEDGWQATFKGKLNWEIARYEQLAYAHAGTRPLAICRAALKVMAEG